MHGKANVISTQKRIFCCSRTYSITMKLIIPIVLAVFAAAQVEAGNFDQGKVRHRELACIKKGRPCEPTDDDCCGAAICEDSGLVPVCCLEAGVNGCDDDSDCCDEDGLVCIESVCVVEGVSTASVSSTSEPRPCGIHGEPCKGNEDDNDCCGDMKYSCEEVSEDPDLDGTRCCIPVGGKGCSFTFHCCGAPLGNYCDPIESRCVYPDGSYPTDAVGLPDCSNKGGECVEDADCCGSTRLLCEGESVNPDGETINVCCVKTGITGCDKDDDCCSGTCDLDTSTCCIAEGKTCSTHGECCTFYCNGGTCDTLQA